MLFNSISFLVFFPVVALFFFTLPRRFQWMLLLVASAYFYMAFVPWYILILLFLIVADYRFGQMIEKEEGRRRKMLLIASIICNLGTLFLFKYFNFFNDNIAELAQFIGWNYSIESLKLALPIGLSFHVFQSLSYVIEVYRGKQAAEKHLGIYALYVLFFPQLVAGPIERPQQLLPQLHLKQTFDYERVMSGLTLMLWGFFKKLVIADQLAVIVDHVYGNLPAASEAAIVIAVVLFAVQLYCDFSGYSDIAVGAARVFGFELMRNFERPYASRSVAEFWRKWHISLSNWLRDYLYYPLALSGKKRKTKADLRWALFVTFVLIGLWHGANWTFVMLGAVHGMYLVVGEMTKAWRTKVAKRLGVTSWPKLYHAWQVFATFCLVSVSWVFFRAPTMQDAWYIISSIPKGILQLFNIEFLRNEFSLVTALGLSGGFLLLRLFAILTMEGVEYFTRTGSIREFLLRWPLLFRLSAYYGVILWILLFGYFGAKSFIYFQF